MKGQPAPPVGTPIVIVKAVIPAQSKLVGKCGVVVEDKNHLIYLDGAVMAIFEGYYNGRPFVWLAEQYAVASPNWEFIHGKSNNGK